MEQLEFFPISEEEKIRREMTEMKKSQDKVRKSLFARHGDLAKLYMELKIEFEFLKEQLCKSKEWK